MKWDQGLGIVGLLLLATALAMLLTIGIPITVSKDTVELKDWLGFAGTVLGAIVTLGAAVIAWRAVQKQIAAQRDAMLLDVTTREEDRLEADLHAINVCLELGWKAQTASTAAGPASYISTLTKAGLSGDELEVRSFILTRVGGPVRPAIIRDFGEVLSSVVLTAQNVASLARIAGVHQYGHQAPTTKELDTAIHHRSLTEERLARVVKKYKDRQAVIESDLAKYRERIDAGLRTLHD